MTLDPIARMRRFNRAVTQALGALDTSFLGRGRPLGSARVLNAIGQGITEISAIRDYLGLDSGLMSRLLRGLEAEGLVETMEDRLDARRRNARLTDAGAAEFAAYEALSNAQAQQFLDRHSAPDALLAAMDLVASTLASPGIVLYREDPRDEPARYCLGEYYAELNRRFAGGFDVNLSRDPEAAAMMPPRGCFVVAMSDGLPLGCVGLKGDGSMVGEIKRLWVAPAARGLGLARRLMGAVDLLAVEFGMRTLRLDTNSALPEAAALYRRTGWHEIPRFNDDPYPDLFFEKKI